MISSIYQYTELMRSEFPEKAAFQWYDESIGGVATRSFAEFVRDVRHAATYLKDSGVRAGDHVAIIAPNSYGFTVMVYAIMLCDAVAVPMNYRERVEVLQKELALADVSAVLTEKNSTVRRSVAETFGGVMPELYGFESITEPEDIRDSAEPERMAAMIFTSGTMGENKCVVLSLGNFSVLTDNVVPLVENITAICGVKVPSFLCLLPLYHIISLGHIMRAPYLGMTTNLCPDMRYLYRDMQCMDSDFAAVVPMLIQNMHTEIANGRRDKLGTMKVLICGGAAMDPEYFRLFAENGVDIVIGYGLTESMGIATIDFDREYNMRGSIGRALDYVRIGFDDGELRIQSGLVMQGYYKMPEETAEILRDGWLYTGDLGYEDENGYIYLTGRKKNLIILASGENVSPEELEALLYRDEDIKEALVCERDGKLCAELFCDEDRRQGVRQYVLELNRSLNFNKRMNLIEFRDTPFERTASGKIKRT